MTLDEQDEYREGSKAAAWLGICITAVLFIAVMAILAATGLLAT